MSPRNNLVVMIIVTVVAACTRKDKTEAGGGGAATNPSGPASAEPTKMARETPSATGSVASATVANDPLPSHSDLARKVRAEITKQNYKSELDKLEKEMGQP